MERIKPRTLSGFMELLPEKQQSDGQTGIVCNEPACGGGGKQGMLG